MLRTPLVHADVEGVYAGLRPLLSGESDATSKLSREHVVAHPAPGLVVVAGGKYTTYRVMAEDAVDEAARALDEQGAGTRSPTTCRWSVRRASTRCGTSATCSPSSPGCTSRASSTCCAGRAR